MPDVEKYAEAFEAQALSCFAFDAPLYGKLNEHCAEDDTRPRDVVARL